MKHRKGWNSISTKQIQEERRSIKVMKKHCISLAFSLFLLAVSAQAAELLSGHNNHIGTNLAGN